MKPHETYKTEVNLFGTYLEVTIAIYCEHSELSLDDVIGDAENKKTLERKIERGDLMIADIHVVASIGSFIGQDCLGGCYIASPKDVEDTVTGYGMVDNAIGELKETMLNQFKTLKELLNK